MNRDFSSWQRQSFNGIFLIFFADLLQQFKRFFYAFFAPFLSENFRENYAHYLIIGIVVFVILQFVFSYWSYLNYQFKIQHNAFVLKKGVIKRSTVEIPFHRIQNINIQQHVLQQILGVVGFQIETAGEGAAEVKIKALDKTTAQVLKETLLEETHAFPPEVTNQEEDASTQNYSLSKNVPQGMLLFSLSFIQLLKVGLSSNYLKGFGLLILFLSSIQNFVSDILSHFIDVDFEEDITQRLPETFGFFIAVVFVVVLLSFLVTIAIEVFKYFGLKVVRLQSNFEVSYGLFKRNSKVIKKDKTQVVTYVHNPILRFFKMRNVYVSQASSKEVTEKQKIGLVGISTMQFEVFFEAIFSVPYQQTYDVLYTSKRFMLVLFWKQLSFHALIGIVAFVFHSVMLSVVLVGCSVLFFSFLNFKTTTKSYLSINDDLLRIGSGNIHTKEEYIALHKIQSIKLRRSVFQRYNGHADVLLYTASGSISVPYLPYQEAVEVVNIVLYKVESSSLSWI